MTAKRAAVVIRGDSLVDNVLFPVGPNSCLRYEALMRSIVFKAVIPLTLLVVATNLRGQTQTGPSCADAKARASTGQIPVDGDGLAHQLMSTCGRDGPRELATGIRAMRHNEDMRALDRFMSSVDNWRSAELMDAAISVAQSGDASVNARVLAVRHLLVLLHPQVHYSLRQLTVGIDSTRTSDMVVYRPGCSASMGSEAPTPVGTPLPADYQAEIRRVLRSLSHHSAAPRPVRNAALCA